MTVQTQQTSVKAEKVGFFRSLMFTLLVYSLAISVVPLVSMMVYSIKENRAGTTETVKSNFQTTANAQGVAFGDWLEEQVNHIQFLSMVPEMRTMDPAVYGPVLQDALSQFGAFGLLYTIDTSGMQVYKTDNGTLTDLSDRAYVKSALEGNTLIGEATVSKANGKLLIPVAAPVKDGSGKVIGIIAGSLYLDSLSETLKSLQFGETGEIIFLDNSGKFLTDSRFTKDLLEQGIIKERAELEIQIVADDLDKALNGESAAAISPDYRGVEIVGAFAPVRAANIHWAIMVKQDTSEAFADLNRMNRLMTIITLIVGIFVIVIAVIFTRNLLKQMNLLMKAGNLLSIGDAKLTGIPMDDRKKMRNRTDEIGAVGRSFTRMIAYQNEMADITSKIANGDLTVDVTPKSEQDLLGNSLKQMVSKLRDLIEAVQKNAQNVNEASRQLTLASEQAGQATTQIAMTIQQVATGTSQQSEATSRTAQTMENTNHIVQSVAKSAEEQKQAVDRAVRLSDQLSKAIQSLANSAQQGADSSKADEEASLRGVQTVNDTIDAIQRIKDKVGMSASKVEEMGSKSEKIGVIVETIDDIASQTNLLSLNAAIEAARAGEHGKGFAVVADEVRKLAERSSNSTKEIAALIKSIQSTVTEAVTAMQQGMGEVENGVITAGHAGSALNSIRENANMVLRRNLESVNIAGNALTASTELSSAIEFVDSVASENLSATKQMTANTADVNEAIENIASISEENSAAVEEVSASAEEMSAQVEEVHASAGSLSEMAKGLFDEVLKFNIKK